MHVGPAIEEWTGIAAADWSAQPGRFQEALHPEDSQRLAPQLPSAARGAFRFRHVHTGRITQVWEERRITRAPDGRQTGYEGIWLDITERSLVERRLLNALWRETKGRLTTALTHDFSNITTGLVGLSESIQAELAPENPLRSSLQVLRQAALDASQFAQRIHRLYQGMPGQPSLLNLNESVRGTAEVLRKVFSRRVEVQTELSEARLPIFADPVEFHAAMVKLALNAVDAMPRGGRMVFQTNRHPAFPGGGVLHGALPEGPLISLSVKDTGWGIPSSVLPRIFDPLFTTKASANGVGLGLYSVRRFLEHHRGAVSVETTEGQGTTFHLWFAEARLDVEPESCEAPSVPNQTLLWVDAEPGADDRIQMLRRNGYYVAAARDQSQALDLLCSAYFEFAAAIVSSAVARENAFCLCRQLRQGGRRLKVIILGPASEGAPLGEDLREFADLCVASDADASGLLEQLRAVLGEP